MGVRHIYRLVISGSLPGLNDFIGAVNANRHKGNALKRDAELQVSFAIRSQLRGVKITKPVVMRYMWVEKDRRRDLDNISSYGRKVIQDALVKCHILKNDGWNEIIGFSDSFVVDKKNPRIEIEIEEV